VRCGIRYRVPQQVYLQTLKKQE
jgi:transposase